jgi:hemoglobin
MADRPAWYRRHDGGSGALGPGRRPPPIRCRAWGNVVQDAEGGEGMGQTLFDRYGGFPKVSKVVSTFYDRVLDEPSLESYFVDVDMRRLIDHQTKFIATILGGPASFTSEHIAAVHRHLRIDDKAFEEILAILRETLEDHDFEETDIGTVVVTVRGYRNVVVTE